MARNVIILLFMAVMLLSAAGQEFTVMFYNTENLFDTIDDTTKNDEEFLPEGSRRWTGNRYHKKINDLARVIAAAGEWELPALVGLCEVENGAVVMDLAYGDLLSAGQYGIVHRDSPDLRGIDVALMYRRDHFRIAEVRSWVPLRPDNDPFLSRNLLYAKAVMDCDTLHVIVCHFPSRRGGVLATQAAREEMAELLRVKTDSINMAEANAKIVVMGDFNASPHDVIMKNITCGGLLMNMSGWLASGEKGTYRYQGTWEMIDQILVTASMLDSTTVFYTQPGFFKVVDAPFLLIEDETYPGLKPFPTYGGYMWSGGYSDHLPVLVKIKHH